MSSTCSARCCRPSFSLSFDSIRRRLLSPNGIIALRTPSSSSSSSNTVSPNVSYKRRACSMLLTAMPRWSILAIILSSLQQLFHQPRYQLIGILLPQRYLVADRCQLLVVQAMSAHFVQQFVTHHFRHPRSPVRLAPGCEPSVLCQPQPESLHCMLQLFDARATDGDGSNHRRYPISVLCRQRLHRSDLLFHPVGAVAIALVDHKNIGNFHNAGLDALYIVAHAWYQHNEGDVGQAHDIDFILAHP